jgi:hypothetical protein
MASSQDMAKGGLYDIFDSGRSDQSMLLHKMTKSQDMAIDGRYDTFV